MKQRSRRRRRRRGRSRRDGKLAENAGREGVEKTMC